MKLKHCQEWRTPRWLFEELEDRYAGSSGFTIDAAAGPGTAHLCNLYFSREHDALSKPWTHNATTGGCWTAPPSPSKVFCNPPYNDISPWVEKARSEILLGGLHPRVIVMLLPARPGSGWWNIASTFGLIEPIRGRVEFEPPPGEVVARPGNFEWSVAVVFRRQIDARGRGQKRRKGP
jgi:phage N-6-adenine-methyltransferase